MKLFGNHKEHPPSLATPTSEHRELSRDLDLVEIPLEGVAAYWLSLHKVLQEKKASRLRIIRDEAAYTTEPYVSHLLEIAFTDFSDDLVRRYATIKQETILRDLSRKLVLISIGLLGIATNENPQQVLVRIISKFPVSPILEKQVFETASDLIAKHGRDDLQVDVDHRMHIETLIVHLIFFCMLARRQGREACQPYLEKIRSLYFTEGLSLIIDNFDADFIKHRLNLQKSEILNETRRKMSMSLEMCLATRNSVVYDDVFKVATSFLL